MNLNNFSITSLVLSTAAFFVAQFYARRYLDEVGIPKGMTRNMVVLIAALIASYGVGYAVDWVVL